MKKDTEQVKESPQAQEQEEGKEEIDPIHEDLAKIQKILSGTSQARDENSGMISNISNVVGIIHNHQSANLEPHLQAQFHSARANTERAISRRQEEWAALDRDNPRTERREIEIEEENIITKTREQDFINTLLSTTNRSAFYDQRMGALINSRDLALEERKAINETHLNVLETHLALMAHRDNDPSLLDDPSQEEKNNKNSKDDSDDSDPKGGGSGLAGPSSSGPLPPGGEGSSGSGEAGPSTSHRNKIDWEIILYYIYVFVLGIMDSLEMLLSN